ncbi:MAG: Zn-finger nucleic acid-binding protein [Planctomycetota bacterium]|jgi:Zn-finger nucleic acid-binding protein
MLLQACPNCGRQYEVAHLEPGSFVRCICDARFNVKPTRDLRVQGLRCRHCGAPISAEDEQCAHCTAALDERDRKSSMCPNCMKRLDEDAAHCSSCGTKIDPQALPPIPVGKSCPRCKGELQIRSLEVASVIECSNCSGLWLDPVVFKRISLDAERGNFDFGSKVQEDKGPAHTFAAESYIPCLDCDELMLRRQYKHRSRPIGVVLDYCRDHGIWFDGDELSAVLLTIQNGKSGIDGPGSIDESFNPSKYVSAGPKSFEIPRGRPGRHSGGFTFADIVMVLRDMLF